MLEYAKVLLPYIVSLVTSIAMYFLGVSKNKAELNKLQAETKKTTGEEDRNLINFYKDQTHTLIEQVKQQLTMLEQKEAARANCEEKLHDLEVKYNGLSVELSLLKNKLS